MTFLDDRAAIARRNARRNWRVVWVPLSAFDETSERPSPEAALAMMWRLALDAWAMTGRALPDYSRAATPVRRVPLSTPQVECRD